MINAMTAIITMAFSHVVTFAFDYHQASESTIHNYDNDQWVIQGSRRKLSRLMQWLPWLPHIQLLVFAFDYHQGTKPRRNDHWSRPTKSRINLGSNMRYMIEAVKPAMMTAAPTQLLLFGPPPLVHLDKESQTHSIQTLPISPPKWQPVLKFLRGYWNFCKYSCGNSYLAHLHRCRRGGGGEQLYFCSSHQTKPGRKLSSGFNVARSSSLRSRFESAPGALPLSRLGAWGSAHDGLAPVLHVLQAPYNFWGSSMWTTHLNQVGKQTDRFLGYTIIIIYQHFLYYSVILVQ